MDRQPLTDRQAEVLNFCCDFVVKYWSMPTRREIAARFDFTVNGSQGHISALIRKGWLVATPGVSRGLKLAGHRLELVSECDIKLGMTEFISHDA